MRKSILHNVQRLVCVAWVAACASMPLSAQSVSGPGKSHFEKGLNLQKTKTVEAQNQAISEFKSARNMSVSKEDKDACNKAIANSEKIKRELTLSPILPTGPKRSDDYIEKPDNIILSVSRERLEMDEGSHTETINVKTTEQEWTVTPIANKGEKSFVTVNPHPEQNSFDITCEANSSSQSRSQYVKVMAGTKTKHIFVEQNGKPVELYVENTVVTFGNLPILNKTKKSIKIYSNSNEKVEENNNMNWKVLSKPSWVNVIGERLKEKKRKNVSATDEHGIVTSIMNIVPLPKPTGPGAPTRSGEIIIVSGNQKATIIVQQD